jgi:hypothetical protein
MMDQTTKEIRATQRALEEDIANAVVWLNSETATVSGRTGTLYTVRVDAEPASFSNLACTCPAGEHGNPCWHAAAVLISRLLTSPKPAGESARTAGANQPIPAETLAAIIARLDPFVAGELVDVLDDRNLLPPSESDPGASITFEMADRPQPKLAACGV